MKATLQSGRSRLFRGLHPWLIQPHGFEDPYKAFREGPPLILVAFLQGFRSLLLKLGSGRRGTNLSETETSQHFAPRFQSFTAGPFCSVARSSEKRNSFLQYPIPEQRACKKRLQKCSRALKLPLNPKPYSLSGQERPAGDPGLGARAASSEV